MKPGRESASTLHPRLCDGAVLDDLRRAWTRGGESIRIESVLAPGLAGELAKATGSLRWTPYHLTDPTYGSGFFWRSVHRLDGGAPLEPPLDRAADFARRDLPALVRAVSGRESAIPEAVIGFCRFRKGCYLDLHNDIWDRPALGWVIGLTREPWPEAYGGHLTFFAEDKKTSVEVRPPGFDTLDLYTVHPVPRWHAVPILRAERERITLAGLLTEEPAV